MDTKLNMSDYQTLIRLVREKIAVAEMDGSENIANEYKNVWAKLATQLNYLPEYESYIKSVKDRINA